MLYFFGINGKIDTFGFYCIVLDNSRKKRELYAMENDETGELQRYKRAGKYDQ